MKHSVDGELSRKTKREVTAALVHLRRLLRVRNPLRFPLLKLPTETIVRILSFFTADLDSYSYTGFWWSIYGTCHSHRIHEIMCNATILWWRIDSTRPKRESVGHRLWPSFHQRNARRNRSVLGPFGGYVENQGPFSSYSDPHPTQL